MTPIDFYHIVRNCVRLSNEMIYDPSVFIAPDFIKMCSPDKFNWKSIVVNYCEIIRLMKPFFRWMPVDSYTWFDHYATNCDNHEIILSSDVFNQFISAFSLSSSGVVEFGPYFASSYHEAALEFAVGVINAGSFVINHDAYAMIRTLALSSDQTITNFLEDIRCSAIEELNSKQQSGDNSALMAFYEFLPSCDGRDDEQRDVFVPSESQMEMLEESLKREVMFVTQLRWSLPPDSVKEVQARHDLSLQSDDSARVPDLERPLPTCPLFSLPLIRFSSRLFTS